MMADLFEGHETCLIENSCRSFKDRDSQQQYYMRVNFRGDSAAKDFESTADFTVQLTDVESAWQAGRCLLLFCTNPQST